MAIRSIRDEKDPILRKRSKEVTSITEDILILIDDMKETMEKFEGVGIAAVQVGVLKRIIIVELENEDKETRRIEMINPEIIEKTGEQVCNEGCLSIPGYTGDVLRPKEIKVRYKDREGNVKEEILTDLGAVVVSHETDHLDGILFIDKADNIIKCE